MKKATLFAIILAFLLAASSCNKRYTCAENGQPTEIFFSKDYTPSQLQAFDSACVRNGGFWEVY